MRRTTEGPVASLGGTPPDGREYSFRRVTPAELPTVNDLYNRCHHAHRSIAEAEWLYQQNPYGEAIVFGAFDSQNRLVGMRPVIPHRFLWGGKERQAYEFVDAVVAAEHRNRGIFRRLVDMVCDVAEEADVSLFSFPNDNSLPVYQKMPSLRCIGRCETLAKALSWGRCALYKLGLGGRTPGTEIAAADDAGPSFRDGALCLTPIRRFDSDFEDIHGEMAKVVTSFTLRRERFLNWRYFGSPERRYHAAVVLEGGCPQGYVVVRVVNRIAHIVDAFLRPERRMARTAFSLVTHWVRGMGAIALYFEASKGNVFQRAFEDTGFVLRKDTLSLVVDRHSASYLDSLHDRPLGIGDVYFAMGDSDVA